MLQKSFALAQKLCAGVVNSLVKLRYPSCRKARVSGRRSALSIWLGSLLLLGGPLLGWADTTDLTEAMTLGQAACANQGIGVFADIDEDGVRETFVVFNTINGSAAPHWGLNVLCGSQNYGFTGIDNGCAGGVGGFPYGSGRFSIWFVDALAPGFVANSPSTWTYKAVPAVRIGSLISDDLPLNNNPNPYRQVSAYTARGQGGTLIGSYTHLLGDGATRYQVCEFSSLQGIAEIYIHSDSFENGLDCFTILANALHTVKVSSLADSGPGTLRNALAQSTSGDTVVFADNLAGTISLTSGELVLAHNLSISGPGAAKITVDAKSASRIFNVQNGVVATICGLTLSNGRSQGASGNPNGGAAMGGGILNNGTLTICNCVLVGNSALGGNGQDGWAQGAGGAAQGGAVFNGGTLWLNACTLYNNVAGGGAGGIGGSGDPGGNGGNGGAAAGGAIYSPGTLQAANCTFWNNTAIGGAGGMGGENPFCGTAGNGGNGDSGLGGAIKFLGQCSLINCTVSGNAAFPGAGGVGGSSHDLDGECGQGTAGQSGVGQGGGLHVSGAQGGTWNSIISGNSGGDRPDISGPMTSEGHNLIGTVDGNSGWGPTDQYGSMGGPLNPLLGPLQDNGGPTPTMALNPVSPALDAGDDAVVNPPTNLTTDQRGQLRQVGAHVDIGALESKLQTPSACNAGRAISFDGVDGSVDIGAGPLPPPWTAEFWVKRQDAQEFAAALLSDSTTALRLEQFNYTRRVGFTQFGVADYAFNYTAPVGTWVHLAFVCSGSTQLYVNGLLQDSLPQTIPLGWTQLGAGGSGGNHMRGLLDEVRVWSAARTPEQIQAGMYHALAGTEPGLVAYWHFDEGEGSLARDATGHGYPGTLQKGTAWVSSTAPFPPCLGIERSSENVVISWPSPSTGYVLQESSDLVHWKDVALPVADDNITKTVVVASDQAKTCYRLRLQ